jgi:hypothetical protein
MSRNEVYSLDSFYKFRHKAVRPLTLTLSPETGARGPICEMLYTLAGETTHCAGLTMNQNWF